MRKEHLLIFGLALLAPCLLLGKSMSSPESRMVRSVAEGIRLYQTHIEDRPIESWDQIAKLDMDLHALNTYLKDQDISELYSFVPIGERSKFPDGDLILIRYEALPYPEILKDEYDPDDPRKERNESFYKPVRYLVYRDAEGELHGVRWYEEDIQKMLRETGIKIPPPEKFTNNVVAGKNKEEAQQINQIDEPPVRSASEGEEALEVDTPEPSEKTVERSSKWWLWLIGAVVVVGGIGLVLRRKS